MAADVRWQHLPYDVVRHIIDAASRLPQEPPHAAAAAIDGDPQLAPPTATHHTDVASLAPDIPPLCTTPAHDNDNNNHNNDDGLLSEPQEELFLQSVRTLRMVCPEWRDAAASAVTRLQLQSLALLPGHAGCGPPAPPLLLPLPRPSRHLPHIFPELAELDLMAYERLCDDDLAALAGCRRLQSLRLVAQYLTAAGLAALAPLTSLDRIELRGIRVGAALAHLLRALPRLRHATLRNCSQQLLPPGPAPPPPPAGPPPPPPLPAAPHVLTTAATPAQKRFPSARSGVLGGAVGRAGLAGNGLAAATVAASSSSAQPGQGAGSGEQAAAEAARAAPAASPACLAALPSLFPELRCFRLGVLRGEGVTEEGVGALAGRLAGLTRLELQGCSRLRSDSLGGLLSRLSGLRSLDLTNCLALLDSGLAPLSALSSLTSLKLRGCWKIRGEGCSALAPPAMRLRHLDLSDCRVTDAGLQQVARLACLTSLRLVRCWQLEAPGLAALSRLTRLQALDLGSTNADNCGLEQMVPGLGRCLTDLDLSATLINRHGVAALAAGLPRLRRLKLNRCKGVDDACLEYLTGLSCLRRLHVRHCRNIGDAAAAALAGRLPRLQHFELDGCWGVAMATIDRLYGRPNAEWRRTADVAAARGGSGGGNGVAVVDAAATASVGDRPRSAASLASVDGDGANAFRFLPSQLQVFAGLSKSMQNCSWSYAALAVANVFVNALEAVEHAHSHHHHEAAAVAAAGAAEGGAAATAAAVEAAAGASHAAAAGGPGATVLLEEMLRAVSLSDVAFCVNAIIPAALIAYSLRPFDNLARNPDEPHMSLALKGVGRLSLTLQQLAWTCGSVGVVTLLEAADKWPPMLAVASASCLALACVAEGATANSPGLVSNTILATQKAANAAALFASSAAFDRALHNDDGLDDTDHLLDGLGRHHNGMSGLFTSMTVLSWALLMAGGVALLVPALEESPLGVLVGEGVLHASADVLVEVLEAI
ncbi:hypothetical protein GPECTOR_67g284 [Gonium pectorale]|uniref:F-box domain-containing protein n=1 Tax=Gonium pectorale TaxID=33097 RepID=A0A150G3P4_GONPE|nr:hypothetical protein GPECTOR_67g284 [Gonium pectorale]|eukprot:KXZ44444.1 hypothetical protein GPECTOR_67g284 [Gonium pectorale]